MANFVIGRGTKLYVALLPVGDETEPAELTLTTTNSVTAKGVSGPVTITLSGAVAAGKRIVAGNFLNFVDEATGKEVLVELTADVEPTDTTIEVAIVPEDIPASAVATFPMRLKGRTAANLDRSGNTTSVVDFENEGYSTSVQTSIEQGFSAPGSFLPTDAGFATCEKAFEDLRQIYVWLELPKTSAAYSKGRVYHGPCAISNLPLEIPADGALTGNLEGAFNGKPRRKAETPV